MVLTVAQAYQQANSATSGEVVGNCEEIDAQGTDKHTDGADDVPHQHDLQLSEGRAPYRSVAHFQPISEPPGGRRFCRVTRAYRVVNLGLCRSPRWAELPNKDSCENQIDGHISYYVENRSNRMDPNSTFAVFSRYLEIWFEQLRSKYSKKSACGQKRPDNVYRITPTADKGSPDDVDTLK